MFEGYGMRCGGIPWVTTRAGWKVVSRGILLAHPSTSTAQLAMALLARSKELLVNGLTLVFRLGYSHSPS